MDFTLNMLIDKRFFKKIFQRFSFLNSIHLSVTIVQVKVRLQSIDIDNMQNVGCKCGHIFLPNYVVSACILLSHIEYSMFILNLLLGLEQEKHNNYL